MSQTVVVLGATGALGREISAQLVARGHRVVAVARNAERLEALARRLAAPRLLSVLARPLTEDRDGELLVRALRDRPARVTAVVSAMRGPVAGGRLLDRPATDVLNTLADDVVSHFVAARHLLPLLAESGRGGRYLLLGGPMGACAWAGYGHLSIAAAALQMLTQVLREEAKELPLTVQQLQVGTPVRTPDNAGCGCPDWLGADEVARRVVALIEQPGSSTDPIVQLGPHGAGRRPGRVLSQEVRSLS